MFHYAVEFWLIYYFITLWFVNNLDTFFFLKITLENNFTKKNYYLLIVVKELKKKIFYQIC